MTHRLRRAGAFAAVASLVLAAPVLGPAAAAPFAVVAVLAAFVVEEGRLFELFARPGDHEDRRLNGLAGFALAAAGLGILTVNYPRASPMPDTVFAAAVLTLAYGNLGRELVRRVTTDEFALVAGFVTVGTVAGTVGQAFVAAAATSFDPVLLPKFTFLAAVGSLVAAMLRSILFGRDDPLVVVSVGFLLWLFAALTGTVPPVVVAVGLGLAIALGWISYALDAASVPGMLTGVLLAALSVVLGGYGWFAVLISFFSVGALATKYRYDEKADRGVAEENDGARGTGNVLGNAAVALFAVVGYVAADRLLGPSVPLGGIAPTLLAFAFASSVAAAMADTLSSEFGGLYDHPRLVTTFERVDPGTDGAVTWQGELAGLAGGALVGAIAAVSMPLGDPVPALVIVTGAGVIGMTVDSLLGATVEGVRLTNQTVNFLATLAGALAGIVLAVPLT